MAGSMSKLFCLPSGKGSALITMNLCPFRVDLFKKALFAGKQTGSHKSYLPCK